MRRDGMVTAVASGTFVDDYGVRHKIIRGVTGWAADDPDLRRPEVARLFGRSTGSRSIDVTREIRPTPSTRQHGQPESGARPSWYLGPTEPRPRTDDELQRTARHEAGHAAAAYLLGWDVQSIRLRSSVVGQHVQELGSVSVLSPRDLDPTLRARQLATITLTSRAHVGWTYDDAGGNGVSYRTDRKQAWEALARVGRDPRATGALFEQARAQAS